MPAITAAAEAGDADAAFALDVFSQRVAQSVAAMAVAAGGFDALVFTAGTGENSDVVRELVCSRLDVLGAELDAERSATATPDADVAGTGSPVRVLVVRAREELIAARVVRAVRAQG